MKLEDIVSDEKMNEEFLGTDFGSMTHREVLSLSVLKCASGYYQGHTSMTISKNLGLIALNDPYRLTQKGMAYLWECFRNGSNF